MGFTKLQLLAFQDAVVPDRVGSGLRLLFVGTNPSLWTAATGAHFARPGNRFYPALAAAGIIDRVIDAGSGMTEADREHLLARGIGITNIVARASAGTGHGELSAAELREEAAALAERVAAWRPPPGQQA